MNLTRAAWTFYLALVIVLGSLAAAAVGGCASPGTQQTSDEVLRARVQAALVNAADVPGQEITVEVSDGVVTLTGQVSSDGQRGVPYPSATVQQSIGAVVRAVPGVQEVRFSLEIDPVPPAS